MSKKHQIITTIIKCIKIVMLAVIIGLILGVCGGAFYYCIKAATSVRQGHPFLLLMLPVGACLITLFYHAIKNDNDGGTDAVIEASYSQTPVSLKMAPAIFLSTVFSHLCGASVGREGAALQLGGSVGYNIARLLRLTPHEKNLCVVMGMSACFSALFGTPIAAAVFALEIAVVGQMNIIWLLPSVMASYIARIIARYFGAPDLRMQFNESVTLQTLPAIRCAIIAAACGVCAMVFCELLQRGRRAVSSVIKSPYLRALICGAAILGLSFIFPGQTYNGAGIEQIDAFMHGDVFPLQFLIKMIFTVISVIAGYRGGEIVPSFYIGAALGSALGGLIGVDSGLACAVGMLSLFCGVTNCPIAAFMIGIEIFGSDTAPYFLIASALSFVCSGRSGLYSTQKR